MTTAVATTAIQKTRGVERIINGQFVMDGAGVKINRVLTGPLQRRLDPFLMLDAFGSDKPGDYIAGFPEHPHRASRPSPICWPAACATVTVPATKA